jgi:hypothetical protein
MLHPLCRVLKVFEPHSNGAVPRRESDQDAWLSARAQHDVCRDVAFAHEAVGIQSLADLESEARIALLTGARIRRGR